MTIYLGQTRSRSLMQRLDALGFGEMTTRAEVPPRRRPWALDNGAFGDWKAGRPFDHDAWCKTVSSLYVLGLTREGGPDFIVAPDIVAGGVASLGFSLKYALGLRFAPVYLAVQDGMDEIDVARAIDTYDGIFVGGTLRWKIEWAPRWVTLAHRFGKPCHIGRVGTFKRVRWARRIGADSIDSCLPLWSEENLIRFLDALGESPQTELAVEAPPRFRGASC